MAEAVGILEVFGLATAFVAADAGCKAANVHLEVFDKNKPANADSLPVPLLVCIKYRGSVSDVTAAVEAGMKVAESMTGVVQHLFRQKTCRRNPCRAYGDFQRLHSGCTGNKCENRRSACTKAE